MLKLVSSFLSRVYVKSLRTSKMKYQKVLIDLSGTIHIDDQPVPAAIEALQKLRDAGLKVKFVTNTTKESKNELLTKLCKIGFKIAENEVQTSLTAASDLVKKMGVRPMLMLEDGALEDFQGISTDNPNAVVVGLAPSKLNYQHLDRALHILLNGGKLIGIHKGKYYQKSDGKRHIGPGAFVAALEFSSGVEGLVVGKPERNFFEAALESDCKQKTIMIGDDAQDDVEGALKTGIDAILVQTGKYRKGDERSMNQPPTKVCTDFPQAVHFILNS